MLAIVGAWFGRQWVRVAVVGAIALAILAALWSVLASARRAGRDAQRAADAEAVERHQEKTAEQVRRSDAAIRDPNGARAKRVRDQFQRRDDAGG